MPTPELLRAIVPTELLPESEWSLSGHAFLCSLKDDVLLEWGAFTNDERFGLDRFLFLLVSPRHSGEKQVAALRCRGDDRQTMGYLFPSASLRPHAEIAEERWMRVYAHAATEALIVGGLANHIAIPDCWSSGVQHVVDLFSREFGVVVLGKDQLQNLGLSLDEIAFAVQEHGAYLISDAEVPQVTEAPQFRDRLALRRVSTLLKDDVAVLSTTIARARRQSSAPARFITTYQILEFLIAKIFVAKMHATIHDVALLANVWELRECVNEIAKEKYRLHLLVSEFAAGGDVGQCTTNLRACCEQFLALNAVATATSSSPVMGKDWADVLYECRNLVVHRQSHIEKRCEELLWEVCDALEAFCFAVAEQYSQKVQIAPSVA